MKKQASSNHSETPNDGSQSSKSGTNDPSAAVNPRRIKGQSLRLHPETWLKLKLLAATLDAKRGTRVTQHDLLLEAVDDLFLKYSDELKP